MSLDVLTVGDAVVDLFLLIDPNSPHFKFDKDSNEISIKLGDKVVFNGADFRVGGNACNVSIGLKKLGIVSGIMAEIGNDEFAQKILYGLKKAEVDITFIKRGEGQTSFSVILNYKDDRSILMEKVIAEHDFKFDTVVAKWIYLTSLSEKWEQAFKNVSEFLKESGTKLVFNPGAPQFDKGLETFSYLLPQTEILILNKEEAGNVVGKKENVEELLSELKKMGPKTVVITDGENGSYAISEDGHVISESALKVNVVSRTGAGDAYASGFLSAIVYGKNISEAMKWGTKNAAAVIGKIGAQAGLLTREELQ